MASIIRIKRRVAEEPAENLYVSCKKRRLNEGQSDAEGSDVVTRPLKFAGTVEGSDEEATLKISRLLKTKEQLQEEYKKHVSKSNAKDEQRKDVKARSQSSRLKLINARRSIASTEDKTEIGLLYDTCDENDAICCNGVVMKSPEPYVYDIYYVDAGDLDNAYVVSEGLLVHEEDDSEEEECDDESDENDEDNWRNDYPDEDEFFNDFEPESDKSFDAEQYSDEEYADYLKGRDEDDKFDEEDVLQEMSRLHM